VCRAQSVGDLDTKGQNSFYLQRLATDSMLEGETFEELHGDERLIPWLADFVDRADVRMVKGGCGPRLSAESFELPAGLGLHLQARL
jgi:hypothetical protein